MKQNKKVIALTGLIGSGKSTVSQILSSEMGFFVVDCDKINAEILTEDNYLVGLKKLFPTAFVNGKLEKKIIKEIIFNNESERLKLNEYAHGKIKERLVEIIADHDDTVFCEVPLLNQTDYEDIFDEIWIVTCPEEDRIDRIMQRDSVSREMALKIISSQSKEFLFNTPCIYIINDKDKDKLLDEIKLHL